jgi:hypothetical protein
MEISTLSVLFISTGTLTESNFGFFIEKPLKSRELAYNRFCPSEITKKGFIFSRTPTMKLSVRGPVKRNRTDLGPKSPFMVTIPILVGERIVASLWRKKGQGGAGRPQTADA